MSGDGETFTRLSERWRQEFAFDSRLVGAWSYAEVEGQRRLTCETTLPEGVEAEVPPPAEKRVAIGDRFLDEVRIRRGASSYVLFPIEHHRGVVGDDGVATIDAKIPSALQLFAEGALPPLDGPPVEVTIGVKKLVPMLSVESVPTFCDSVRPKSVRECWMFGISPSGELVSGVPLGALDAVQAGDSPLVAPLVTAAGTVYAGCEAGVCGFTPDGQTAGTYPLAQAETPTSWSPQSGVLYAHDGTVLYAIAPDGHVAWQQPAVPSSLVDLGSSTSGAHLPRWSSPASTHVLLGLLTMIGPVVVGPM